MTNQHPVVVTNQHPVLDPIPAAAGESAAEDIPVEQPMIHFLQKGLRKKFPKGDMSENQSSW